MVLLSSLHSPRLGLLSDEPVALSGSPIAALAAHLQKKLELGRHSVEVKHYRVYLKHLCLAALVKV